MALRGSLDSDWGGIRVDMAGEKAGEEGARREGCGGRSAGSSEDIRDCAAASSDCVGSVSISGS